MHTEVAIHSTNAYVVLEAKSVAYLIKSHLLPWEVVKVKFLMNSYMTLTVLNLHQKTDPILFIWVLRHFQHCTGHIMTGSWKAEETST